MAWIRVADRGSIKRGAGTEVCAGGKRLAVFNQGDPGGLQALDAMCAHQNQSIACGSVEDGVVECPHHFWHYDIKTGKLLDYVKDVRLETYPVQERDDGVYVDV